MFSKFLSDIGIELTNIVALPFSFEGKSKFEKFQKALTEMSKYSKSTVVFNADSLKKLLKEENVADNYIEKAILFAIK